ncbi:hypothetical protein V6N12_076146 [Hibiscus sabdariffa]|uniref:Uncharacterized protein n=1 Tax=Hibiscus sabdariffa TaxID=183260 RepID=A0ABR2AUR1_9ROSI
MVLCSLNAPFFVTHALSTALAVLSNFSLTFSLPSHERRFGLCMVNKQESSWMLGPFVIFMDTIWVSLLLVGHGFINFRSVFGHSKGSAN